MGLRLYDTAARELRQFTPLHPGRVGMYICGLTTQGTPHIGHLRFAVAFDILRRWLTIGHGYDVTLVRNVTDIDDKILRKSAEADVPWWAWSYRHELETTQALQTLGVLAPTYEPRATGHITEMVELMETLVERGHAYPAPDGSGDVYFDVRSWPSYGELTRQNVEEMESAEDADPRGKRDPRDFALWKGYKQDEPATASWPAPYGRGRPGWHLECSAMARKYLGDTFDIHGGGVDLRFPHHENEQAQSRAAGLGFARYWMHNGWLTASGEKMSKSLGNGMTVSEVTRHARPLALRYYLGASHYRSTLEYGETSLTEAAAAVDRIEGFLRRVAGRLDGAAEIDPVRVVETALPAGFREAMDDDVNVAGALAVVHETVREGNTADDDGDLEAVAVAGARVAAMTSVLGVNPLEEPWSGAGSGIQTNALGALEALIGERLEARAAARKARDFAAADLIRTQLGAAGVAVEDTTSGARWSLVRPVDGER
ncbi:MAG: cysteine--tRNA ligase [Austwickia sp.]|nr:cysteine--tRNA ligase [Austwickia sp.]MBK8436361.1 cysteine--tRNA ligase [Austwickia sp.]MBK9102037.1 cysteine--tRNA ligase [Austwickia sp.]